MAAQIHLSVTPTQLHKDGPTCICRIWVETADANARMCADMCADVRADMCAHVSEHRLVGHRRGPSFFVGPHLADQATTYSLTPTPTRYSFPASPRICGHRPN